MALDSSARWDFKQPVKVDALLLRGLAHELHEALQGAFVRKISQLHDADFLWTFYRRGETSHLLMSLSAEDVRMHLTDAANKPMAQTPGSFCMLLRKHVDGAKVISIDTWGLERVLRMHFGEVTLYVEMTVLERNMLLSFPGGSRTWHRPGDSSVLPKVLHQDGPELGPLAAPVEDWKALVRVAFGLNRLAAEEICSAPDGVMAGYERFRARLVDARFEPTWSPSRRQAAPWPYRILADGERCATFSELFDREAGWATRAVDHSRQLLRRRVEKAYDKVSRKLKMQEDNLKALTDVDGWRHYGDLLLSIPAETRPAAASVRVQDLTLDPPLWIDVPVDRQLSLSANAQAYYNRYKKGLRGRDAIRQQLGRGRLERDYLAELLLAVEQAGTQAELAEVGELLRGEAHPAVEKRPGSSRKRTAIRRYRIEGYEVMVGRNPRQNEEISIRLASPTDLWLHAREVPGSHVLVRNPHRQPVPDPVIHRAAALAAAHSQARTSSKVTVVYTEARHLRRPPQAPPGTVTYRNESSVVVSPGVAEELIQN